MEQQRQQQLEEEAVRKRKEQQRQQQLEEEATREKKEQQRKQRFVDKAAREKKEQQKKEEEARNLAEQRQTKVPGMSPSKLGRNRGLAESKSARSKFEVKSETDNQSDDFTDHVEIVPCLTQHKGLDLDDEITLFPQHYL